MADQASSAPRTPFDWLHGGLFSLGKSSTTTSSSPKSDGIEGIESCKDVASLLKGISENLDEILAANTARPTAPNQEAAAPPVPEAAASKDGNDEIGNQTKNATTNTHTVTTTTTTTTTPPSDFLAARLSRLRFLLYDERRRTSSSSSQAVTAPTIAGTTVQGLTGGEQQQNQELVPRLLENLVSLPFESRKHVAAIFNYLLVSGLEGADAALYQNIMQLFRDFVVQHFDRIMTIIVQGHSSAAPDVGLHSGAMYRSCLRHAVLYRELVRTSERVQSYVYPFLDVYVHNPNFEISSDAMESLRAAFAANSNNGDDDDRAIVVQNSNDNDDQAAAAAAAATISRAEIAAEFLTRDYEEIWDKRFNPKLLSEDSANYMTRRVALQILSSVLLTRSNYAVMIRYVASRANLITIMTLLRDTSPHITLDAFHVFKVFVANPNKPPEVVKILKDNKVKLCRYLTTLHQEKEESDTQFRDEKALIIATIDGL